MVHIYTGDGKGKTTAALGLTLRACGAGMRVYFAQFLKSGDTSEARCLTQRFPDVTLECFGGGFVIGAPTPEQIETARAGFDAASKAALGGEYDLVVLDEAIVAVSLKLLPEEELVDLIERVRDYPKQPELVMTGRGASRKLIDAADLVTEMRNVKHYYEEGIAARRGIEF
ncbi:MAG: cob(I)yrinic acid a,c-diamide adenosyltransferase [Oscillospiraceae bacterium]|nr:cob(I)yrinic acid a,c-diamide adenosyltransferase [Oscillospiraceae bacterium]